MSDVGVTSSGPTVRVRGGRSTSWWGMVGMIATEGTLFALLLFVYWYFRAAVTDWPPGDLPVPGLKVSGIRTAILLGSSIPMMLAEHALEEKGHTAKAAAWLFVAEAMAAIFLIGHIQEQFVLFDEISPMDTAYGSTVVTILNFHAAHLIIGMLIAAFMLIHLLRGRITKERSTMMEIGGMYWHFVDAVWVFVFFTIFVSPHLFGN